MASVSETIVREYLETLGFLVQQPTKYQVTARAKRPDEEFDLLAINPIAQGPLPEGDLQWTGRELRRVGRAMFSVRGWHTERFSPAILEDAPEILRIAEPAVMRAAERWLGPGPIARVLCLPALPAGSELREGALQRLRAGGVDGVLTFRTMLVELSAAVDASSNYEKSDVLQMLRILKTHGLLRDAQLDLFHGRGRRSRRAVRPAAPAPGAADARKDRSGGAP